MAWGHLFKVCGLGPSTYQMCGLRPSISKNVILFERHPSKHKTFVITFTQRRPSADPTLYKCFYKYLVITRIYVARMSRVGVVT